MSILLEIQNLNVRIPLGAGVLHAVRDVSFHINRGETLCIVGESGCGKSLTSMAIMNLLPKQAIRTADRLEFDDEELIGLGERDMSDIRGDSMAMIFQEPMTSLNPTFSIGNQLEEALLRHRKVKRSVARERAVYLLEKVGIKEAGDRLGQYPHQLSGGLRQRVMIAMALMCGPKLIIADEPTTALDVTIQAEILDLLSDLKKEFDMALMLITHDLGVVAKVADRVAVMYAGEVIETGPLIDVFGNPHHPYAQGLMDCVPIPGRTKPGDRLGSIPGLVPNLIGSIKGCAFRNRCKYLVEDCAGMKGDLSQEPDQHSSRCLVKPSDRIEKPISEVSQ